MVPPALSEMRSEPEPPTVVPLAGKFFFFFFFFWRVYTEQPASSRMERLHIVDLSYGEAIGCMTKKNIATDDMKKILDATGGQIMYLERICGS
jgi:hypothetical protein